MSDVSQNPDRRALLKEALRAVEEMQAKLQAAERARTEPIAIVGMACRFPGGADSPETLWSLLRAGTDAITEVPAGRWSRARYSELDPELAAARPALYGGFLRDVDTFDASFFGITPREAAAMDPQHRLVLEVCWEALESAGCAPRSLAGTQTGVFVGITASDYWQHIREADPQRLDVYIATGNSHNAAAGRVAFTLGLQGPALAVDTACSSSLSAVHLACQSLRLGESTLALAGGVNTIHNPDAFFAFHKWGFMAGDGRCKTFDASADGFVRGEGCAFVVLKRLSDALADGDTILATIRGSAINQDGATSGFTVPNALAQEAVIRQALRAAGVSPLEIDYVEAHGTGTALGDPIELEALDSVLCDGRPAERPLVLGSIKTNLGHLESAAGIAGLMKVVLSLQHQEIPPHLHFKTLNPKASVRRDALVVPRESRQWRAGERPRRAGISSFGISGTNAHLVVEEAPRAAPPAAAAGVDRPVHVLTVSGRDAAGLAAAAARMESRLATSRDGFADAAFTANTGRTHFGHRAAVVARSADEARRQLGSIASNDANVRRGTPGEPPRVGFVFGGDVSPHAGVARDLYDSSPVFRAAVDRCAEVFGSGLDRQARVALFAQQYALAELWRSWGVAPALVSGHGVGEYVAACVAGAITLEDAVRLAAARDEELEAIRSRVTISAPRIGLVSSLAEKRVAAADLSLDISPTSGSWDSLVEALASLYVRGAEIDWKAFDRPYPRRKVSLPTYPFKRERFWIEAKRGAAPELSDCFYKVDWRPQPSRSAAPLTPGTWLLLSDRQGVGDALAAAISQRGGRSITAFSQQEAEERLASIERGQLSGIVHLWSLDFDEKDAAADRADAAYMRGAGTLARCARLVEKAGAPGARLFAVTRRATPGLHDGVCAAQAPTLAAGRVIALEHPELWGASIDLDGRDAAAAAGAIAAELAASARESEVAYCGDRRVPRLTRAQVGAALDFAVRADATYLITGGTGGIGQVLATWLADRGARHLAFVSRRGRPQAGAGADAIAALEARGVSVRVAAADVADAAAMSAIVRDIEQSGAPLRGVFHAAGVLRNDAVMSVTDEAMRDVARPKIAGACVLDAVTRDLPLDLFVLFSSGASVWGSKGLVHYAAANQFLDAFAYVRRQSGRPALAINWGPWDAGMATPEAQQAMAAMGVTPLSPAEGTAALERALSQATTRVAVARIDWPVFAAVYRAKSARPLLDEIAPAAPAAAAGGGELAREIAAALPGDRHALALDRLQAHAAAVFGLTAARPDPAAGLSELGMDSLMAVELRDRLQRALAMPLPPTLAFDCPTIDAMAAYLVKIAAPAAPAASEAPSDAPDAAAIAALSQDEVRALLADELQALAMDAIVEEQG